MDSNRPTLLELCIQQQMRHTNLLSDVSGVDDHILERLLPLCDLQRLTIIENCTRYRDLSPITNNLWKNFYEIEFGVRSANSVIQRMEGQGFKWYEIYQAKLKEREETARERLQRGYAGSRAQTRQIKRTPYVPPRGSRKKIWWRR